MSYDPAQTPHDNLVRVLREKGYTVDEPQGASIDRGALVTGRNIMACFAHPHSFEDRFAGRILADHAEAFNKWSQVPVNLTIPDNGADLVRLLAALEWAGSPEGFKASNEFDHAKWITDEE